MSTDLVVPLCPRCGDPVTSGCYPADGICAIEDGDARVILPQGGRMTYRVGNHQPQNVYRGEQYIGVMFTAEDAALVIEALNGRAEPMEYGDSCTCTKAGPDPDCIVHQGRRARGPQPPPLGSGCICDGSGRTCPRHGAVL